MSLSKTLTFKGLGWEVERTGGLSCRIDGIFQTPDKVVYLQIMCVEVHRKSPQFLKELQFEYVGTVVHCARDDDDTDYNERVIRECVNNYFLYTKEGIVKYINDTFATDFTELVIS